VNTYVNIFPRKKRKKNFEGLEGLGADGPLLAVCLSVCRRKLVSHFKAREITFSGLVTLRLIYSVPSMILLRVRLIKNMIVNDIFLNLFVSSVSPFLV
jgi:hypothetical protein